MTDLNASRALFFLPFDDPRQFKLNIGCHGFRVYKLIIRIISLNESTIESKKVVFLVLFWGFFFCFLVSGLSEWVGGCYTAGQRVLEVGDGQQHISLVDP